MKRSHTVLMIIGLFVALIVVRIATIPMQLEREKSHYELQVQELGVEDGISFAINNGLGMPVNSIQGYIKLGLEDEHADRKAVDAMHSFDEVDRWALEGPSQQIDINQSMAYEELFAIATLDRDHSAWVEPEGAF